MILRPLGPAYGVEVRGIDARNMPTDDEQRQLRDACDRYSLLLLRDQQVSADEQVRFAAMFGQVCRSAQSPQGVSYISNVDPDGFLPEGELPFHSDRTFLPNPQRLCMLYAIEVPRSGGETLFASAKLAYRQLPEALKARIADLKADFYRASYLPEPRSTHPVVLAHPITGEGLLYVNRQHTARILNLEATESDALLAELLAYVELDPRIQYCHAWRPGDIVLWDNLALQHARNDFDPAQRRHMRRISIDSTHDLGMTRISRAASRSAYCRFGEKRR